MAALTPQPPPEQPGIREQLCSRWLGSSSPDPGCDGAFELLDRYVDALHRGVAAETCYPAFVTHIRNCAACRDDTEGLLAALDDLESSLGR